MINQWLEGEKLWGGQWYLVGIICPPPVRIGLTDLPNNGGGGGGSGQPSPPGSGITMKIGSLLRTYIFFLFDWLFTSLAYFFVVSTVSNLFKWLTQYSAALLLHQGLFSRSDLGEHKNMHTCVNNLTYLIHLRGHSITTFVYTVQEDEDPLPPFLLYCIQQLFTLRGEERVKIG